MSTETTTSPEAFKVRARDANGVCIGCLGHKGEVWRNRVYHGAYTKERADLYAKELSEQNPGFTFTAERYKQGDGLLAHSLALSTQSTKV